MRVVTTFALRHYESGIAKKMVETFLQYWEGFELHCYINGGVPNDLCEIAEKPGSKLTVHSHYQVQPELGEFVRTYQDVTKPLIWGSGEYNYKWDVTRFAHKVYALKHASRSRDKEVIWLDADVITHASITLDELLEKVLCSRHPSSDSTIFDIAWLDRETYGPECGFLWLDNWQIIEAVHAHYSSGVIFKLPEWHDSYVFGKVVPNYYAINLAAGIDSKHPWPQTQLGTFCTHLKGPARKRERADLTAEEAAKIPNFVRTDDRYIL